MDLIKDFVQDTYLLALVCWREARGEPPEGKAALCYSIMNRVVRPSWWGSSVPSVVWKKWQYSSMTDPHDPQLSKLPTPYEPIGWRSWRECLDIAIQVYNKEIPNPAKGADSYFADGIPPPKWADQTKFVVKIGHHSFYDLDSDHERQ
jgi:spore germination cell wall hydrolase CwlJ-like protein